MDVPELAPGQLAPGARGVYYARCAVCPSATITTTVPRRGTSRLFFRAGPTTSADTARRFLRRAGWTCRRGQWHCWRHTEGARP